MCFHNKLNIRNSILHRLSTSNAETENGHCNPKVWKKANAKEHTSLSEDMSSWMASVPSSSSASCIPFVLTALPCAKERLKVLKCLVFSQLMLYWWLLMGWTCLIVNYIVTVLVAVSTCIPRIKTENQIHRNAGVIHVVKLVISMSQNCIKFWRVVGSNTEEDANEGHLGDWLGTTVR